MAIVPKYWRLNIGGFERKVPCTTAVVYRLGIKVLIGLKSIFIFTGRSQKKPLHYPLQ